MFRAFCLAAVVFSCAPLFAAENGGFDFDHFGHQNSGPGPGLPSDPGDDSQLFAIDTQGSRFFPVPRGAEDPSKLYLRFDSEAGHYVWVTGADNREIVAGSWAQGWRFSFTGLSENKWYRLDEEHKQWRKDLGDPSDRPCILRREGNRERGVSQECAADGWERAPECRLSARHKNVSQDEHAVLEVSWSGKATEYRLVTRLAPLPLSGFRPGDVRLPKLPRGDHQWFLTVMGPGGRSHCDTTITVGDDVIPPKPGESRR